MSEDQDRDNFIEFAHEELKYPRSNLVRQLCEHILAQEMQLQQLRQTKPPAFNSTSAIIPLEVDAAQIPTINEVVQRHVKAVLDALGGNKTRASRILGISRFTLHRLLRKMANQRVDLLREAERVGWDTAEGMKIRKQVKENQSP